MVDKVDILILESRVVIDPLAHLVGLCRDLLSLVCLVLAGDHLSHKLFERLDEHCSYVIVVLGGMMISYDHGHSVRIKL